MAYFVGCDAHKKYSQFAVLDERGEICQQVKVMHARGAIRGFLERFPSGTKVALETVGNWYWILDEIEGAGCEPCLAHAQKAKLMMGHTNKTDKLDSRGLALLLRNGTLPMVWMPPQDIRDERELTRTRMFLRTKCTSLKNRIHATFAKYGLMLEDVSDLFGKRGRKWVLQALAALPPETRRCIEQQLVVLDELERQVSALEDRIREKVKLTQRMQLLKSLPGVGDILAIVIEREVGHVERFPGPSHFASYSGTVPKVTASGGKIKYGRMRRDVNQYLKWAFIEAASVVARHHAGKGWQHRHVSRLYRRIRDRKGHAKAVGAVARHLAEAAYWVLRKGEPYREPKASAVLPTQG